MFDLTRDNMMIQTMDRALTLASQRQTLIASNLANLDTPGYRTRDFSFEGALRAALSDPSSRPPLLTTHAMHFQGSTSVPLPPSQDEPRPKVERNDGNDVSLDRESMLLARTQGTYQMASTFMQGELRMLYMIVREGSK